VNRVVESVSPARMGVGFRWLLASSWVSNLGDGMSLAAGPLLVASQTRDPTLVALASLFQRLPWLLFGLYAGVVADRLDRRLVVVAVDLLRAAVLVALSTMILAGQVDVGIVLAATFVLGTAETFADTTTSTLLPMLVDKSDLGVGNARLIVGHVTVNMLAGPPIGAALFAAAMFWPFAGQAVCVALGAVLISRISLLPSPRSGERRAVLSEIGAGIRWLWRHPPVRTLTLTIVTFNVTFGAAWSVLVLYAIERLGMGEIGFGLLTTVSAVGGVLGAAAYRSLERRMSLASIMRAGLVIETFTHLGLATITVPWAAMLVFFVFGAHASVWNTTATSIRQRAVPTEYQGRVASVYMTGVHGGLVAGAALGGLVAGAWGVTGPFWFAFAGSALILLLIWRQLANIAHVD
jgi:predicted MFS family arabinose efflux permease